MSKVVFIRHAESVWNRDGRFTGWTDVDLTQSGMNGAHEIGAMLRGQGFSFDVAYTSMLKRAIRTLWIVLWEIDRMWIPVERTWRLNERHYGNLQGENKEDVRVRVGDKTYWEWRRAYSIRPPALSREDQRHPIHDERYEHIPDVDLPGSESLEDTLKRTWVFWLERIEPEIKNGREVLISAHGNSIRAMVKELLGISNEDITLLDIPYAIPLVFEFDHGAQVVEAYFLEENGNKIKDIFHFSERR